MFLLKIFYSFVPSKLVKYGFMTHVRSFYYKDKEEQKIFDALLEPHTEKADEMEHR